jgi:hypothetical protein
MIWISIPVKGDERQINQREVTERKQQNQFFSAFSKPALHHANCSHNYDDNLQEKTAKCRVTMS